MSVGSKVKTVKKTGIKSRAKLKWSLLPLVILLSCMYFGIFHSHRYFKFNSNLWVFMIGSFSLFALKEMLIEDNGKWEKMRTFLFILLVGGPLGAFVLLMHKHYTSNQLKAYGIKTTGVVTKLFSRSWKNGRTHYAIFTYKIHSKIWRQDIINEERPFSVGDSLNLICSEKDPEVFTRLED